MAGITEWRPVSPGPSSTFRTEGPPCSQLHKPGAPDPLGTGSCLLSGEITDAPRDEKWVLILLVKSKYSLDESGGIGG